MIINNGFNNQNDSIRNWNKISVNGMEIYSPKLKKQDEITTKKTKIPFLERFDTYKQITDIKRNKSLTKYEQSEKIKNIISTNSKIIHSSEIELIKDLIQFDILLLNTYKNINPVKKIQNITKLKLILKYTIELHKKQKALKKYQKLLSQYQR